ncbi:hypothetical protein ASC86_16140 [Rhizobium sp. Root1212]|nr:hypothetical protein ASC86_16140 [Rhizobium sp. Root1212]
MRAIEFNHVRRHKPLDVYFIPIERCALMEIPKVLLETTCGRSADLEAFATTFFDFPSGGMMGNCFLLHDKRCFWRLPADGPRISKPLRLLFSISPAAA